jgi:hypothetical protein
MKPIEAVETEATNYQSLEAIKALPTSPNGAFMVIENGASKPWVRFSIIREHRDDDTKALHPQISATDGTQKILLALSKSHGWHIQLQNGDFEFNRKVLRYLNNDALSVDENVFLTLGPDFEN